MTVEGTRAAMFPDGLARLRTVLGGSGADMARLWPSLEALDWITVLPSSAAPHFIYLAGASGGTAVGGGGRTLAEAAGRCAGEAAEVLAQAAAPRPALDALKGASDGPRVLVTNLADGQTAGIPAAWVHLGLAAHREAGAPPASLGLAAGTTYAAAHLAGLLELIERDAAHAWWQGEVPPRALDASVTAPVAADLAAMREGAAVPRATGFLHLPSPTGVPVVCAFSRDPRGAGLALGLKAALDLRAAVDGAMIELLQMELALELALRRTERRQAGPGDDGPLRRAALDPDRLEAFAARPPTLPDGPPIADLDALVRRLAARGTEIWAADLEVPGGVLPVAKVVTPSLNLPRRSLPGSPGERAPLV